MQAAVLNTTLLCCVVVVENILKLHHCPYRKNIIRWTTNVVSDLYVTVILQFTNSGVLQKMLIQDFSVIDCH